VAGVHRRVGDFLFDGGEAGILRGAEETGVVDRTESLVTILKIELLGLLHDSSVERLKRPDIVRIKLGKSLDLLC
jgi:hypothetical protein